MVNSFVVGVPPPSAITATTAATAAELVVEEDSCFEGREASRRRRVVGCRRRRRCGIECIFGGPDDGVPGNRVLPVRSYVCGSPAGCWQSLLADPGTSSSGLGWAFAKSKHC